MLFTLATWNVNSVRSRLDNILSWLREVQPDMVLLQEVKCLDEQFPTEPFEDLFYNVAVRGQKAYHGVAILSKQPLEIISKYLPGDQQDQQARYLECNSNGVRIINVYAPNGNPIDDPVKFPYKLNWMQRLIDHAKQLEKQKIPLVIAGDYNVIPTDEDCYNPKNFVNDAVAHPLVRKLWRELVEVGFTDSLLQLTNDPKEYTYWGYRGRCWSKNAGLRLDHYLVNRQLWPHVTKCYVDRQPRNEDHASDHTPVVLQYKI